jgi:hypothetical protein
LPSATSNIEDGHGFLVEKFETSAKDRTLIGSKVKHLDSTNFFVSPEIPCFVVCRLRRPKLPFTKVIYSMFLFIKLTKIMVYWFIFKLFCRFQSSSQCFIKFTSYSSAYRTESGALNLAVMLMDMLVWNP